MYLLAALTAGVSASAEAQISLPKPGPRAQTNGSASRVLQQMADTYAHLTSIDLKSIYSSPEKVVKPAGDPPAPGVETASAVAAPPPVKTAVDDDNSPNRHVFRVVELLYAQPNLYRMIDKAPDEKDPGKIAKWVCDGKMFYAFVPHSHRSDELLYTQEKAPRQLKDFPNLRFLGSASLELVMMMGVNPFANLNPEVVSIHVEPSEVIRGVEADVISLSSLTRTERNELTMYIGKTDHLLHRVVTDVFPTERSIARIGDALDEMDPNQERVDDSGGKGSDPDNPLEVGDLTGGSRQKSTRIHLLYDNVYTRVTHVETETFSFAPPSSTAGGITKTASLFTPLGGAATLDPNARRLAAIIRKSRKNHSKPIHDVKEVHEVSP